jgi:polyisoprenoid-binding protein YceI
MKRALVFAWICAMLLLALPALAQEVVFQLDPVQSRVQFTLPATLHSVHGTFRMKSGTIRFNPASGETSGALVVDATSGESGNNRRDRRMHREILEDQKYPDIVFTPQRVIGKMPAQGGSSIELQGVMSLHGEQHPMTITVPVQVGQDQISADAQFVIPYVQWGLKNPSTFLLRVSDKVTIDVHCVGRLTQPTAGAGAT